MTSPFFGPLINAYRKIAGAAGVVPTRGTLAFPGVTFTDDAANDQTIGQIEFSGAVYTIDASSATPSKGTVVALKLSTTSEFTIVVAAAGAFQGGPLGVLPADHVAGDTSVVVAIGGTLPNSITGLGASAAVNGKPAGSPYDVILTPSGGLAYSYVPTGGETIIGHSPGDGRVTLNLRAANVTSPLRTYSPVAYGAAVDANESALTGTDDLAVIEAMIGDISAAAVGSGSRVDHPDGYSWLSDDLILKRPIHWVGRSGGGGSTIRSCGLMFAPGKGIILQGGGDNAGMDRTDGTIIGELDIISKQLVHNSGSHTIRDIRVPNYQYAKGSCVIARSNVNPTVFWRWGGGVTGSSPGGDLPAFTGAPAAPGTTASDGTGTWTAELFPVVRTTDGTTTVPIGTRLLLPNDNRHYFEVTVAGILDNAGIPKEYRAPIVGATLTDGTATVMCKSHSAFRNRASFSRFHDLYVEGFTNCAGYFEGNSGSVPATFSDFCGLRDIGVGYCGMGFLLQGSDANGLTVQGCNAIFMGANLSGTGGVTVWDVGLLSGHLDLYSQDGSGPAYLTGKPAVGATYFTGGWDTTGATSSFFECFSENSLGDRILYPATVIGPRGGGTDDPLYTATGFCGNGSGLNWFAIDARSGTRTLTLELVSNISGNSWMVWKTDQDTTVLGLFPTALLGSHPVGWTAFNASGLPGNTSLLLANSNSHWPSGGATGAYQAWAVNRFYIGPLGTDPMAIEPGAAPPGSGYQPAGSLVVQSAPAAGVTKFWLATTGGTPGTYKDVDDIDTVCKVGQAELAWGDANSGSPITPQCAVRSKRHYLATTNATANQIAATYVVPINTADRADFILIAKLSGAAGSAFFSITKALLERLGGDVVIKNAPTVVLDGAYDGLSSLTAGDITVQNSTAGGGSGTTGGIDFMVTGIVATNIGWTLLRQGQEGKAS